MFRAVLFTQWKWARLTLLVLAVLSFGLPLLSVQGLHQVEEGLPAGVYLQAQTQMGSLYPMLAALIAVMLATSTWAADHAGRHVYAGALPVRRSRFVALRLAAGLALLAVPAFTLWIGGLLAAVSSPLPPGLQAYPNLLALRFLLAALVAFGFFFAIASGTARTAGWVLGLLAAWLLAQLLLSSAGSKVNIILPVIDWLVTWPGPFDIFSGHWVLIDV